MINIDHHDADDNCKVCGQTLITIPDYMGDDYEGYYEFNSYECPNGCYLPTDSDDQLTKEDLEIRYPKDSKYKRYAELKAQIKELTEEAKDIEADILSDLSEQEGKKLITPYATYSVVYRPKWQYSIDLVQKEAAAKLKLKQLKEKEEKDGTAIKIEDGGSLRCQIVK